MFQAEAQGQVCGYKGARTFHTGNIAEEKKLMAAWQTEETREVGNNQIVHSLEGPMKALGCPSILSKGMM